MSNSIANLSSFTGLSEVELAKRANDLVATGKIKSLNTLDAQLLASMQGGNANAQDAISASAAQTKQAHVMEEPAVTLGRMQGMAVPARDGFAPPVVNNTPDLAAANSPAVMDRAASSGGQKTKAFASTGSSILDAINQQQHEVLSTITTGGDKESRDIQFEQIKMQVQRMSELFNTLSNILSNLNDTAKSAINNIRG